MQLSNLLLAFSWGHYFFSSANAQDAHTAMPYSLSDSYDATNQDQYNAYEQFKLELGLGTEVTTNYFLTLQNFGNGTLIKTSEYKQNAACENNHCLEILFPGDSQNITLEKNQDGSDSYLGLNYISCLPPGTNASVMYPYGITTCSNYNGGKFTIEARISNPGEPDELIDVKALNEIRVNTTIYSFSDVITDNYTNRYIIKPTAILPVSCDLQPPVSYGNSVGERIMYFPGGNTNEKLQYPQLPTYYDLCNPANANITMTAITFSLEYIQPNAHKAIDWREGSYPYSLVSLATQWSSLGYSVLLDCYNCGKYYGVPVNTTGADFSDKQFANVFTELSNQIGGNSRVSYSLMSNTIINGGDLYDGSKLMLDLQNMAAEEIRKVQEKQNLSSSERSLILYSLNEESALRKLSSSSSLFTNQTITDTGPYGINIQVFYNPQNLPPQIGCVSPVDECTNIQNLENFYQWRNYSGISTIFFGISGGTSSNACVNCIISFTTTMMLLVQNQSAWAIGIWGNGEAMLDPLTEMPATPLYVGTSSNGELSAQMQAYDQVEDFLVPEPEPNTKSNPPTTSPSTMPTIRSYAPSSQPSFAIAPTNRPSSQPSIFFRIPTCMPSILPSIIPSINTRPPSGVPTQLLRSYPPTSIPSSSTESYSHSTALIEKEEFLYPITITPSGVLLFTFIYFAWRYYRDGHIPTVLRLILSYCIDDHSTPSESNNDGDIERATGTNNPLHEPNGNNISHCSSSFVNSENQTLEERRSVEEDNSRESNDIDNSRFSNSTFVS